MINDTLYERMNRIRDLINIPCKQHILLQDRVVWNALCDSMDAIEDIEKVLEDYLKEEGDNFSRLSTKRIAQNSLRIVMLC
ncbi:hypothetical protein F4X73_00535 [Candidatus Poribacteria bacterium]|nr:hypothetical protein [Candidatus Poribacteria bacterium]